MPTHPRTRLALIALLALPSLVGVEAAEVACLTPPATMRAARIHAAGGPEALRIEQVPVPTARAGEVLVRIHYASINPVDWKLQQAGRLPFPATPGGDFAGEIVAVGEGVQGFACGDAVAGIADPRGRGGSYAEYAAVAVSDIVRKPVSFSMDEAAAYPTVAIAAWRYLVVAADLQPGERVLVHGGAGGVGSMAVQIAKARGAYVLATASAGNHDYLREIGADEAIDYRSVRFEDVAQDIDVVVDTIGGETTTRSAAVLRDGGRLVTLVGTVPAELCDKSRIACPATPPWDVQRGLAYVAPLIDAGSLHVNIDRRYPLDAIVEAQQHNRSGRTRGKVVVDMGVAPIATPAAAAQATDVKVTVLSTMLVGSPSAGVGEWGFAAVLEVDGQRLLIDTGARAETVLKNAAELKIDLASITDAVITHNHADHTGGLLTLRRELATRNPKALSRVHVPKGIFFPRPGPNGREGNGLLPVKALYEATGGVFVEHAGPVTLMPGVTLLGPVPRVHPERNWGGPRGGPAGQVQTPDGLVEDNVPEDTSIVVDTAEGLVLISGCGHSGIINAMEYARQVVRAAPVYTAIGGFHLFLASEETLAWTAGKFKQFGVRNLMGAHCTGIEALFRLRQLAGLVRETAIVGAVGASYTHGKGFDPTVLAR